MHYFLVNGSNFILTEVACGMIGKVLFQQFGVQTQVVTDPWLFDPASEQTQEGSELLLKLTHMDVRPQDKLSLILDQRERLMKEVIIPAMGDGKVVLYHGGFLNDDQFIDKDQIPYDLVLRENMEMLQSIGGIAYPAGSIVVQAVSGVLEDVSVFEKKARQLGESMARFKQLRYTSSTKDEDLQMLTRP